jgi:hypothetical protein
MVLLGGAACFGSSKEGVEAKTVPIGFAIPPAS